MQPRYLAVMLTSIIALSACHGADASSTASFSASAISGPNTSALLSMLHGTSPYATRSQLTASAATLRAMPTATFYSSLKKLLVPNSVSIDGVAIPNIQAHLAAIDIDALTADYPTFGALLDGDGSKDLTDISDADLHATLSQAVSILNGTNLALAGGSTGQTEDNEQGSGPISSEAAMSLLDTTNPNIDGGATAGTQKRSKKAFIVSMMGASLCGVATLLPCPPVQIAAAACTLGFLTSAGVAGTVKVAAEAKNALGSSK